MKFRAVGGLPRLLAGPGALPFDARPLARRVGDVGADKGHLAPTARRRPHPTFRQGHPIRLRRLPGGAGKSRHRPVDEIVPSMSRRASPLGNAPAESFSHTLKAGLVHHGTYAARAEAKRGPFSYVESFCNRQRLHPALDCRTPEQAQRQAANIAQTAHENRGGSNPR